MEPMHDAAAATISGRTLVFGGGASTTFDTVQALSSGGAASVVGHLPTPVSDLSAAEAGDVAYVAGGYDGRTPVGTILRVATDGRPTRIGTLPTPVRYTALAVVGGRLYAFGGELTDGSDTDLIQRYDPATHRASLVGRLAQAVSHASAVVLHGTIYLLGGRRDGVASAQILRFDPSRRQTSRAGRLPSAVFDAAAAVTSGVGYLAGGIGAGGTSLATVLAVRP
jgi:Kelch motif